MALTDLLHAIQAEADEEVVARGQEIEIEAAAIVTAAASEGVVVERQLGAEALDVARAATARQLAAARSEAARRVRAAREEDYELLRTELADDLATLRATGSYRTLLGVLIDEALAALPDAAHMRVDPRDAGLVAAHVADLATTVTVEATLETWGGVEVSSDAGRRVSNTLEERLAEAQPRLRVLYATAMSGAADEPRQSRTSNGAAR